jgi:hypothetical protein
VTAPRPGDPPAAVPAAPPARPSEAALHGAHLRAPDVTPGARQQQRRTRHRLRIERCRRRRTEPGRPAPSVPRRPAQGARRGTPYAEEDTAAAADARGLAIVFALADGVGFDRYPDHTVGWAELAWTNQGGNDD